jgi:targeting protein for Xklp2
MASIPKFKARPVDRKVLHSAGDLGVPRVEKAPVTTPRELHFASEDRIKARHEKVPEPKAPSPFVFKAAPVVKAKTPPKPVSARPLTIAKTPNFASKKIVRKMKPAVVEPSPVVVFKAAPVPITKTPRIKRGVGKLTNPEPFHLSKTAEEIERKRLEEIERVREAERKARSFHARPLPNLDQPEVVVLGTRMEKQNAFD